MPLSASSRPPCAYRIKRVRWLRSSSAQRHHIQHHQTHHHQRRRCSAKALATVTERFEWFTGAVAVAKISSFFTLIWR